MSSKIKGALLLFLIPAIFSLGGILIVMSDKKADVTHISAGNGFPEEYTVVASGHYRWTHESHSVPVGYILFAISGIAALLTFKKEWINIIIVAVCWLGGAAFIFYNHSIKGAAAGGFTQTYKAEQYEPYKDNPDKMFEFRIQGNKGEGN